MLAGDLAALDKLWSVDLIVNAPDHVVKTRDAVLQAVRASRIRYTAFTGYQERVHHPR